MRGLLASVVAMKILVTNDDGIDAQGIFHLERIAREVGEVVVVAPRDHYSGCSHQMTFEGQLDSRRVAAGRYWVDGFPADCVRIGLSHLCADADVVLSGINHGGNLGLDNYLSGTVAAAREATFFGLPAIAISQYHRGLSEEVWESLRTNGTPRDSIFVGRGGSSPVTTGTSIFPVLLVTQTLKKVQTA